MLLDDKLADDASPTEEPTSESRARAYSSRLSYEDQLYIWLVCLKNGFVGQIFPAYSKSPKKPKYALLIDRTLAVDEINALSIIPPISEDQLRTVIARFENLEPPYADRFRP